MKFKCPKSILEKNIAYVEGAVNQKSTLNILLNIYLEVDDDKITAFATNQEMSIKAQFNGEIEKKGTITLNAKKFLDFIKSFPECNITIELDQKNKVKIYSKDEGVKTEFQILGIKPEDFPDVPKIEEKIKFTINQGKLKEVLKKTYFSASKEESKYILSGVLVEKNENHSGINIVATDGKRLTFIKEEVEEIKDIPEFSVVIPLGTVSELIKILSSDGACEIKMDDTKIGFIIDDLQIYSTLLEGTFPNYKQVIPQSFKHIITVPNRIFRDALNRIENVVDNKTHLMKMKLQQNTIELFGSLTDLADGHDIVDENKGVIYSGEGIEIGFNSNYILEAIKEIQENNVILKLNESHSPVSITGENNDNYINIVMPMKLS